MEALLKAITMPFKGQDVLVFIPNTREEMLRLKKKIQPDEIYTTNIQMPNKGNYLRQCMSFTRYLYDNFKGSKPSQVESFREALTITIGAIHARKINGVLYERAMSWSPENTDPDVFMRRIYNPLATYTCDYLDFKDTVDGKGNTIESARDKLIRASMEASGYDYDKLKVMEEK